MRFVQLYDWGWDHHGVSPGEDIPNTLPIKTQQVDRALTGLIKDLKRTGLLDSTLVIWGGEFGRTPMAQNSPSQPFVGRDHHPYAFTTLLAGGGIKGGQTYGKTDDIGYYVGEDPFDVRDLQATILHLLGPGPVQADVRAQRPGPAADRRRGQGEAAPEAAGVTPVSWRQDSEPVVLVHGSNPVPTSRCRLRLQRVGSAVRSLHPFHQPPRQLGPRHAFPPAGPVADPGDRVLALQRVRHDQVRVRPGPRLRGHLLQLGVRRADLQLELHERPAKSPRRAHQVRQLGRRASAASTAPGGGSSPCRRTRPPSCRASRRRSSGRRSCRPTGA